MTVLLDIDRLIGTEVAALSTAEQGPAPPVNVPDWNRSLEQA
jgi:hypothetical protein